MWTKKNKENKNAKRSGTYAKSGFKLTISILLVLCLGASQAFSLPNKAGLFQRMDMTSQENSQVSYLTNSSEANENLVLSPQQQEEILMLLKESSNNQIIVENENEQQADLTAILRETSLMYVAEREDLNNQLAKCEETIAMQEGQIKELKGDKVQKTFDMFGTYNLDEGWGAGVDVGLKVGHMTTKVGVEALVSDLMNPAKLEDLNTYTFRAGIGFEW